MTGRPPEAADGDDLVARFDAVLTNASQTMVRETLRYPHDATFVEDSTTVKQFENGVFVAEGLVKAKNAMGGLHTYEWRVTVAWLDETKKWRAMACSVGGEILYAAPEMMALVESLRELDASEKPQPVTGTVTRSDYQWKPNRTLPPMPDVYGTRPQAVRPQYRTWTDNTGQFQVEAEFVSLSMGKVKLRKPDGKELALSKERLSQADLDWLKERAANRPTPD